MGPLALMLSLAQLQHGWADVVQPSEPKDCTEVDDNTYTHRAGSHKGTLLNALQTGTSAHQVGVDQHLRQMFPALSQSLASEAVSQIHPFAVDCRLLSSPEMYTEQEAATCPYLSQPHCGGTSSAVGRGLHNRCAHEACIHQPSTSAYRTCCCHSIGNRPRPRSPNPASCRDRTVPATAAALA